ncbi:MAG: hypothetical protein RL368_425, partial [Pseudomonadota bacterium]
YMENVAQLMEGFDLHGYFARYWIAIKNLLSRAIP